MFFFWNKMRIYSEGSGRLFLICVYILLYKYVLCKIYVMLCCFIINFFKGNSSDIELIIGNFFWSVELMYFFIINGINLSYIVIVVMFLVLFIILLLNW